MAEVTVSCMHGVVTKPEKADASRASGRTDTLTVRLIEYVLDNLIYKRDNGEELVTPFRPSSLTKSEPLNPFCPHCASNFVNRLFTTLCFTRAQAIRELFELRDHVIHKLNHNNDQDLDNYEHNHRVICWREWCTSDPEVYEAWIQVDLNAVRNARNFDVAVKALERVENHKLFEDDNCAVCLDEMVASEAEKQDVVMKLPCQHAFHNKCIRKWFSRNQHSCPICRFQLQLPN